MRRIRHTLTRFDWRFWLALLAMLAAIYAATLLYR